MHDFERPYGLADIVAIEAVDDSRRCAGAIEEDLEPGDRGIGHRGRRAGVRSRVVIRRRKRKELRRQGTQIGGVYGVRRNDRFGARVLRHHGHNREGHEEEEDEELVNAHSSTTRFAQG